MTTTTFINGTLIEPAWLNDVNALTYSTTGTGNTVKATAPTITSPTISSGNLIVSTGKVGIGTASPAVSLAISGTDAALIPSGTTAQRPTGATGYIRFNSTTTAFEGYNGTSWNPFNGTVTSVAASVPSFLSVSGSPITSTGTLAITYSDTPLPVVNGGTGTTTSTGTGSTVLSTSPTIISPTINGTPVMGASVITSGTAVASTSGTSIDFTSIPSWVKRITVMFNGVSTNGTSNIIVQIGAGSITSSGYVSSFANNDAFGVYTSTGGFIASQWTGTTTANRNSICTLVTSGSNNWIFSIIGHIDTGASVVQTGAGKLSLGGTLDRLRITTVNGTDTFDAGSINILYE